MRIIIAGSRGFSDYEFLKQNCIAIISKEQYDNEIPTAELEIVSGGAKGADALGERFATEFGITLKVMQADWKDMTPPVVKRTNEFGEYNALGGSKRNWKMAAYARENGGGILIAFDKGGTKGTADMMKAAKNNELTVYRIECGDDSGTI